MDEKQLFRILFLEQARDELRLRQVELKEELSVFEEDLQDQIELPYHTVHARMEHLATKIAHIDEWLMEMGVL